jgi:hypothetical protein
MVSTGAKEILREMKTHEYQKASSKVRARGFMRRITRREDEDKKRETDRSRDYRLGLEGRSEVVSNSGDKGSRGNSQEIFRGCGQMRYTFNKLLSIILAEYPSEHPEEVDGMFRWVHRQVKTLQQCPTENLNFPRQSIRLNLARGLEVEEMDEET